MQYRQLDRAVGTLEVDGVAHCIIGEIGEAGVEQARGKRSFR